MASGITPLINVANLEKSIEFYKGLGLAARVRREGEMTWGEVRSGDHVLMIADKNQGPAAGDPWLAGELGKGVMLNLGVPSAPKTWAKAQALGAAVEMELGDQPWGGKGFMINDPDGYVLMFGDADWDTDDEAQVKKGAAKKRAAARKAPKKAAKKAARKPAKKTSKRRR